MSSRKKIFSKILSFAQVPLMTHAFGVRGEKIRLRRITMTKLMRYFDPFPSAIPTSFLSHLEQMMKQMDFYNSESRGWSLSKGFPKGDIMIEEDKAIIELALAGYERDQLSVRAEDNKIIVSAEKCDKSEQETRTLARRAFSQEFLFNKTFDLESTEVSYKNGLLRVVVPKVKPEPKLAKDLEIK